MMRLAALGDASALAGKAFDVAASPQPDSLRDRQDGSAVIRERVENRRGRASGPFLMHDAVGDQLAELFRQHLLGDARHETAQRQELSGRIRQPVDDDELPLAANGGERRGKRTVAHRISAARARGSYPHVPSSGHDARSGTMGRMSRILLCSVLIALVHPFQRLAERDGQHDFDFEIGAWKTHLSRLDHPLTRSTHWLEYDGTSVVRKVWDGRANLGELEVSGPAGRIEGLTLRLYNTAARQWNITWANANDGMLDRATMFGGFADGRGEFFGHDSLGGRAIYVRFVFSDITPTSFRFEQAFSADGGKTWEVNWKAAFTRS